MKVLRRRFNNFKSPRLIAMAITIAFLMSSQATGAFALDASWYSKESLRKEGTWKNGKEQRMANGDRFSDDGLTGACRLFPLGTRLRVTNIRNGRSVEIIVTDRIGKRFAETRIDLSKHAFELIAELKQGVVPIKVEVVK